MFANRPSEAVVVPALSTTGSPVKKPLIGGANDTTGMAVDANEHTRLVVAVGGADSYEVALQAVIFEHTRLREEESAWLSYCCPATHTVALAHTRSDVNVEGTDSYWLIESHDVSNVHSVLNTP